MGRTIIIEIKCKQIRCQEVSLICCWCDLNCLYWCWSCHLTMLHWWDIGKCILFCTFIVFMVLPHWATGDDMFRAMFTNISKLRSVVINVPFTRLTSQNRKMWTSWTISCFCLQWFWNDECLMQKKALVISTCRCFCLTKSRWPMPHSTSCEGTSHA